MIATFRTIDSESVLAMFDEDLVTCIKEVASEYYDLVMSDVSKECDESACFDILLMLVHERRERVRS